MDIRFHVTGSERKALVTAISELTGWEAVYQKAPTFAYVVNNYTIDKNGTLIFDERTDVQDVHRLMEALAERGYTSDDVFDIECSDETDYGDATCENDVNAAACNALEAELGAVSSIDTPDKLSIEVPLDGFTDTALVNLERLVESKAALICKSIGADSLPIEKNEDRLCFSWFPADASPDEVSAYTQFVVALCEIAKNLKRVTAKEKPVDSEKYAFRCFLLRLGFIGAEYADARKLLLANLPGDGSFRSGKRTAQDATTAVQAAQIGAPDEASGVYPSADDTALFTDSSSVNSLEETLADAGLVHSVNALLGSEN